MATYKGIDVSEHQGSIDFNKVKAAGINFVIIRAGYGKYINQKDKYFEQNYKNAKAAGLNVGAYWYSYADSVEDVKLEAKVFMQAIAGKTFEYPLYFDIEEEKQFKKGKAFCDSLINAFCTALENAGYFAGVYCSTFWFTNYVSESVRKRYTVWIAEYASKCNYKGDYGMWQYGSKGSVNGVKGDCDCDYSYIDYPTIIKNGGFNGFKKQTAAPEKVLDVGSCYKLGDKTVGSLAVKELLRLAYNKKLHTIAITESKDYDAATINAVKALQKAWGYKQTGGAGENFVKMLYSKIK